MTARPQELVDRALAAAGSRDCVVLVDEASSVNLRWAVNGLTTNGLTRGRSVTVMVAGTGGGSGVLGRNGIGADGVAELVEQAAAIADASAPAEDAGPLAPGDGTTPGDWDDDAAETGADVLGDVAAQLGEVFGRGTAENRESFGFALHELSTSWLGTSSGIRRRHVQPAGSIELNAKAGGRTRSTWIGATTRDFTDVDVLAMDDESRVRLGWQERPVELAPGRYDTVLPPSATADLLAYFFYSSDALSAHEGRSVFSKPGGGTRIGERLSELPLTLRSDPTYPGLGTAPYVQAAASSPFASVYDNGLPVGPVDWLDRGVLAALPSTRFTAGLTGLPFHPAASNLALEAEGGTGGTADLVAQLDDGLLLTCLWYIREVDPQTLLLTGLTRDGVYRVRGGEVVGAVTNFRFNESPVDLLSRVRAAGAAEVTLPREFGEWLNRAAAPPLLVRGFNMSTVSEAS